MLGSIVKETILDWQKFSQHLSATLDTPIQIKQVAQIGGGDINQAFQLSTQDAQWFVKLNHAHLLPMMQAEARSLEWIHQSQQIRCPKPLTFGTFDSNSYLILEHLAITSSGNSFAKGQAVARLHQQTRQEHLSFGWFEDNFIGTNRQKNLWHSDWISFYGECRLRPQLELARLNGAKQSLFEAGLELIEYLPFWFTDYRPVASLLHGDLWAGNSGLIRWSASLSRLK